MKQWQRATQEALQVHQKAVQEVLGAQAGLASTDEQQRRYEMFKQNPDALVDWSAQINGRERAIPEAQRYIEAMRKRYGN